MCDRSTGEERNGNSRESKSLEFDKRNFHIVKRMKNHGVKFNEILKQTLDEVYDDDIVRREIYYKFKLKLNFTGV